MNILVSIIMPTYNRAKLLPRAIRSVITQSYEYWELIIILDNCTDDTRKVIASCSSDPRIKCIELSENVGGAEARNIGLRSAQGQYIAFLDDDDEWLPEKLIKQLALFHQNTNVAIVSCNYYHISDSRERVVQRPESISLDDLLYFNACGSFSFCMIRRQDASSMSIDHRLKACQDWDLWIKILKKSGYACMVHQDALVRYYDHYDVRLSTNRLNFHHAYILFLRNHSSDMDTRQIHYNLAYAAFYKNCATRDGFYRKLMMLFKSYLYGFRSRRVSLLGYISFIVIPFLPRFSGSNRIDKWLYHIGYRYFKWMT